MTTAEHAQPNHWSLGWWVFAGFILAAQVGLIFWLSDPAPLRQREPNFAPTLQLSKAHCPEWLKLNDPTLLALPHVESFSGPAWLKIVPRKVAFFEWYEEPLWLKPDPSSFVAKLPMVEPATSEAAWQIPAFTPAPMLPEVPRAPLLMDSALRVDGELAGRRLLNATELPAWPAQATSSSDLELLGNTVIQVVVDGRGIPISATVLQRSGHKPADDFALARSLAARFEPLPESPHQDQATLVSELTWGRLTFEWKTVAPANSP
jgi:hypothetical protein